MTLPSLTMDDWKLLQALARRSGIAPERVGQMERRWLALPHSGSNGAVLTALAFGSSANLGLWLARWQGEAVAKAFEQTGGQPFVIGPNPDAIRPPLGSWPSRRINALRGVNLIALKLDGPISPTHEAALAALGGVDAAIAVTRVNQPLTQTERQAIGSLKTLASTLKILVLALPSDELETSDLVDLENYAQSQARSQGFADARYAGSGVWFTQGEGTGPGVIDKPEAWIETGASDLESARGETLRAGLRQLLDDLERAPASASDTRIEVSTEDMENAIRQFTLHLAELGKRVKRMATLEEFADAEAVRRFFIDSIQGWNSGYSLPASAMTYIESLRPGTKALLLSEAREAAETLDLAPRAERGPRRSSASSAAKAGAFGIGETPRRLGYAVLGGFVGYGAAFAIGFPFLSTLLCNVIANIVGMIAAIFVFTRSASERPNPSASSASGHGTTGGEEQTPEPVSPVRGWDGVESRLSAWFSARMRDQEPTVSESCRDLRERWRLN